MLPRFSLIAAYFPELDAAAHEKLLLRWTDEGTKSKGPSTASAAFTAPYMADVLASLANETDGKDWEDMKSAYDDAARRTFIESRVGVARAKAENFTPESIKALRPDHSCVLVWQYSMGCFQGYWPLADDEKPESKGKPRKMFVSRSRSYREKRSKQQALTEIVRWLWQMYVSNGGDPGTKTSVISFLCLRETN